VPNHVITATHYCAKAVECQQLAKATAYTNLQAGFAEMADLYLQLAIAELYLQQLAEDQEVPAAGRKRWSSVGFR
jgi:hypothetical protein